MFLNFYDGVINRCTYRQRQRQQGHVVGIAEQILNNKVGRIDSGSIAL